MSGRRQGRGRVIDLTAARAAAGRPVFGRPTRCPGCGGRGYLERIDMVDRVMYQRCIGCRVRWHVAETDIHSERG